MYDTAFFVLEEKPANITPIPLTDNRLKLGDSDRVLFVGHGSGDRPPHYAKRAAYVPNLEYPSRYSGSLYMKSVFFDPKGWNHENRPIYGHGEHGDSGGPLILMINNQTPTLMGVVAGGGGMKENGITVEDDDYANRLPKKDLYGKLYSLFAPTVTTSAGIFTDHLIDKMYDAATLPPITYIPPTPSVVQVVEETKERDDMSNKFVKLPSSVLPEHRKDLKDLIKTYETVIKDLKIGLDEKVTRIAKKYNPRHQPIVPAPSPDSSSDPEKMSFKERLKMFNTINH
jgi:hypothetical protein